MENYNLAQPHLLKTHGETYNKISGDLFMHKFIQFLTLTAVLIGASTHAMDTPEQLGRLLGNAAEEGDLRLVQQLLHQGTPVDATNAFGSTPLMFAAHHGHTGVCQLLLNNEASADATNQYGGTSLIYAASNGRTDVCQLLLNHGASVDAKNSYGWTPLVHAARCGQTNVCHLLIDTIVTQIKNNKAKAVVLLGLKKYYQISSIDPIDKNVIKLIAREVHASALWQQLSLFAQIDAADNYKRKQALLAYAREKLNAKSNSNQGNSGE